LEKLGNYLDRPADPFNDLEPVDSSAAAIAAQGLYRFGKYLGNGGNRYRQAGLTVAKTLFGDTYLSIDAAHEGLILHSVYHHPNRWDHVPAGRKVPCGESSMWGDYHARELALYLQREAQQETYYTFFGPVA
jgi:unsaturated chondroitin disaccharide hydrolase